MRGAVPPDFPKWEGEGGFTGIGTEDDITDPVGKRAMGFGIAAAA